MKKVGLLLMLLCFLQGCASESKEIQQGMALRTKLLRAQSVCFETEITADYGDKIYVFSMTCEADDSADLAFTVTAPESIAGITGTITGDSGYLTFDDVALQFDLIADDQLAPVSAPWILLKTLRSGYLTSAGMDGGQLRLSIDDSYDDDALHLDIWLDEQELPARGEIVYDGRRILLLDVKNVQIL